MNCPICGERLSATTDYLDNILLEEHYVCEDKYHQYAYSFVTGNVQESFGVLNIDYNTNSYEDFRLLQKQRTAIIKVTQADYESNRLCKKGFLRWIVDLWQEDTKAKWTRD